MIKSANPTTINLESRRTCEDIMKRIYDENPSYWPYGLSVSGHDGGVYMIREASTKEPIGFTGWQEREEGGKKIGYYSIGILPAYRRNGYAKQAVKQIIREKSANVDVVRAMVVPENEASLNMAKSLGVEIVKEAASWPARIGVGLATGGVLDALAYGKETGSLKDLYFNKDNWNVSRALNLGLNTGLGALIPDIARKYGETGQGLSPTAFALSIPAKDLILTSTGAIPGLQHSMEDIAENAKSKTLTGTEKAIGGGLLGAGLIGGGVLGYKLLKAIQKQQEIAESKAKGRIKVTLPTKDPDDRETVVDMPLEEIALSNTQLGKLQRDTRRRIRGETRERTRRRKPRPEKAEINALKAATVKQASSKERWANIKNLLNSIHA